jgi:hypothetical protein
MYWYDDHVLMSFQVSGYWELVAEILERSPIDDILNYGGQTEIPLKQRFAHAREK